MKILFIISLKSRSVEIKDSKVVIPNESACPVEMLTFNYSLRKVKVTTGKIDFADDAPRAVVQ